jgi:hypothetical protein
VKIYLATSGSYSAYEVHQAFKNEEDAKAYIDGMYEGQVEEYELWDGPVKKRKHWYLVWTSKEVDRSADGRTGAVRSIESEANVWSTDDDDIGGPVKIKVAWFVQAYYDGPIDRLEIAGPSEEAVLKVFSEQRAQYLAQKEGIA